MELVFQKKNIGLGKRKQAIARVFLIPGEGNIIINKISGDKYLQYNDTYLGMVCRRDKALTRLGHMMKIIKSIKVNFVFNSITCGKALLACQLLNISS